MSFLDRFFGGNSDPYAEQARRAQEEEYLRRRSQMRLPYAMPPMRDSAVGPTIDAQMAQGRNLQGSVPTADQIMRMIMQANGPRPQGQTAPPSMENTEPGYSGKTGAILTQALQGQGRSGAPAAPAAPQGAAPAGVPLPPVRPPELGGMPGQTPNGFQLNDQQQAQMRAYADQFAGGDMSKVNTRLQRNEDGSYVPDFYTKGLLSGFFGGGQQ